MAENTIFKGGCHCGKVRWEAALDLEHVIGCNCSICSKQGLWISFTLADNFKLISGEDDLKDYQFGKETIHHLHCTTCGVESFARGKLPDGTGMIGVNVRCLDDVGIEELRPVPHDGKSI